jgi:MFS family permease
MPATLDFLRSNAPWLAAGFLLTLVSSFGQTFFISVFAGQIRAEFGLSHGDWGAVYAGATAASAAAMVWAGVLTDRFRVRHLGPAVIAALAGAALAMAWAGGIVALVVAVFLLRLFGQGLSSQTAMVAMARWFAASRGKAVSVAGLGVAAGEAFLPLIFVALLGLADWRTLWIVVATILVCLLPVLGLLLKAERTPQSFAQTSGSTGMGGRMWSRLEVLRHPVFWLMVPALLGPATWGTAFFFHQVHMAEAKGWSHASLVALFPLFTLFSVGFMILAGALVDRVGSLRLAPVYLLPLAAGYLVFGLTDSPAAGVLGMVLMGAGTGMHVTMMATFWAEVWGTANLGAIRSMLGAVMVMGTALGPGVTGALIDRGWDFPDQAVAIAGWFVVAALMAGLAARRAGRSLPPTAPAGPGPF